MKNEVFNIRGAWRLAYAGVVPVTTWNDRGGAEAQLSLLEKGYSRISAEGAICHVGARREGPFLCPDCGGDCDTLLAALTEALHARNAS